MDSKLDLNHKRQTCTILPLLHCLYCISYGKVYYVNQNNIFTMGNLCCFVGLGGALLPVLANHTNAVVLQMGLKG